MREERDGKTYHHRADIVGNRGVVVELQHSLISNEDVRAREAFYGKMVWLFDATPFLHNLNLSEEHPDPICVRRDAPTIRIAREGEQEGLYRGYHEGLMLSLPRRLRGAYPMGPKGNLQLRPPRIGIYWTRPRKSVLQVRAPLYLDLGSEFCFDEAQGVRGSILKVSRMEDHRLVGHLISKGEFIRRHLLDVLHDNDLRQQIESDHAKTLNRVRTFKAIWKANSDWAYSKKRAEREAKQRQDNANLAREAAKAKRYQQLYERLRQEITTGQASYEEVYDLLLQAEGAELAPAPSGTFSPSRELPCRKLPDPALVEFILAEGPLYLEQKEKEFREAALGLSESDFSYLQQRLREHRDRVQGKLIRASFDGHKLVVSENGQALGYLRPWLKRHRYSYKKAIFLEKGPRWVKLMTDPSQDPVYPMVVRENRRILRASGVPAKSCYLMQALPKIAEERPKKEPPPYTHPIEMP
jgi:hypothetical protein